MLSLDPFEPDDAKRFDLKEYTFPVPVMIIHETCGCVEFIGNMDEATVFMMEHDCTEDK